MSTTVMNTTAQIPSNTTPLTREEMAAYYTTFMKTAEHQNTELQKVYDQILRHSAKIEERTESILAEYKKTNETMETMAKAFVSFTKMMASDLGHRSENEKVFSSLAMTTAKVLQIADKMEAKLESSSTPIQVVDKAPAIKDMSLITTNMPGAWRSQWVTDVWVKARKILSKQGKGGNGATILRSAYMVISDTYPEFDEVYTEYSKLHPGTSKITMCSDSDKLRERMDKYLDDLLASVDRSQPKSVIAAQTPDIIYQISEKLFPNIKQNPSRLTTIYSRMRRIHGCNLHELSRSYAKKLQYSKCSVGYTIANNSKLMSDFEDTVAVMINEQKKGAK